MTQKARLYNWDSLEKEFVRDGVERAGFSGDNLLMVMNWLEPGMETNPHSHPFEQVMYIVRGTLRVYLGDEVIEAGPGSLVRIPPHVEHYGEPVGDETVMNLDIFSPIRADYKHLVEYQQADFGRE